MSTKTPTPRDAAALAEQLQLAADAGEVESIEMTRGQKREFKKALWWGRELYSPVGLSFLFPSLNTNCKSVQKRLVAQGAIPPADQGEVK